MTTAAQFLVLAILCRAVSTLMVERLAATNSRRRMSFPRYVCFLRAKDYAFIDSPTRDYARGLLLHRWGHPSIPVAVVGPTGTLTVSAANPIAVTNASDTSPLSVQIVKPQ